MTSMGLLDYGAYQERLKAGDGDTAGSTGTTGTTGTGKTGNLGGYGRVGAGVANLGANLSGIHAPGLSTGLNAVGGLLDGVEPAKVGTGVAIGLGRDLLGGLGVGGQVASAGLGIGLSDDPAKTATKTAFGVGGAMMFGPLGGVAGSMLGDLAYDSYSDGMIGDGIGSRKEEGARDRAENAGFSRSETAAGYDVDSATGSLGEVGRTTGSSGYSIDPGLKSMDPYGGYKLGDISMSGYDDSGYDDAPGYGGTKSETAASEMGRASGDSGKGNDGGSNGNSDNDGAGGQTGGDKDGGRY